MSPHPIATHRVLVLGHGMVGHRFVADLADLTSDIDPERLQVTVLGAEPYEPYNRVLLSDVLAGRAELNGITLPAPPPRVQVLTGRSARSIDRSRRVVRDHLGAEHAYDTLVLATGAAARVPALAGMPAGAGPDDLPPGVRALRTIDDCRELLALAAAGPAARVVVLGGGLLGIEAARALTGRGARVAVVHSGPHLLDRQLDGDSGAVLAASARDLGITVACGARAAGIVRDEMGTLVGLHLADGRRLDCDALLLTAGVTPRIELAERAGLPCGRGVLVGADLRSPDDPDVAAIGDCAETPGGCPGLLAPGWEQARTLATDLAARLRLPAGAPPAHADAPLPHLTTHGRPSRAGDTARAVRQEAPREVVRLKAAGLDVVTFGRFPHDLPPSRPEGSDDLADWHSPTVGVRTPTDTDRRVLTLHDPHGRRHVRVMVHDGRLAAGLLVGAGSLGADLVVAYERDSPLPLDPADLLVPTAHRGGGAPSPVDGAADMAASAVICRCNSVDKAAIVAAFETGSRTLPALSTATRATTGCGGCADTCEGILQWLHESSDAPRETTRPCATDAAPLTTELRGS